MPLLYVLQEAFANIRFRTSSYKSVVQGRQKIIPFCDGRVARTLYDMELCQFMESASRTNIRGLVAPLFEGSSSRKASCHPLGYPQLLVKATVTNRKLSLCPINLVGRVWNVVFLPPVRLCFRTVDMI
jgi:hypothetical protein